MICKKCGTKLLKTTYNRLYCSNHGILLENQEDHKEETGETDYVG